MKKIKLYIAASLDGFIARKDGSLDWLEDLPNPNQIDHGYADFLKGIDAVIMGRSTYEVVNGFDMDWPYSDFTTYVFSSKSDFETLTPQTQLVDQITEADIERIKSKTQKDIWLVGGGVLVSRFLDLEMIDEMIITLIPVILGEGIPLFPNNPKEAKFELLKTETFETGAVSLTYGKLK